MKRLLGSYRFSQIGGAVVLVLGAAILVLAAGPKQDHTPAVVVIAAVLALLGVRAIGAGRSDEPTLGEHREPLEAREHDADQAPPGEVQHGSTSGREGLERDR